MPAGDTTDTAAGSISSPTTALNAPGQLGPHTRPVSARNSDHNNGPTPASPRTMRTAQATGDGHASAVPHTDEAQWEAQRRKVEEAWAGADVVGEDAGAASGPPSPYRRASMSESRERNNTCE